MALDTNRGHTVKAVSDTFNLAKDAGYKVVSHMMPNLPNVDLERDVEQFIVSFIQHHLDHISPFAGIPKTLLFPQIKTYFLLI